jgi:hypothetical protein
MKDQIERKGNAPSAPPALTGVAAPEAALQSRACIVRVLLKTKSG